MPTVYPAVRSKQDRGLELERIRLLAAEFSDRPAFALRAIRAGWDLQRARAEARYVPAEGPPFHLGAIVTLILEEMQCHRGRRTAIGRARDLASVPVEFARELREVIRERLR